MMWGAAAHGGAGAGAGGGRNAGFQAYPFLVEGQEARGSLEDDADVALLLASEEIPATPPSQQQPASTDAAAGRRARRRSSGSAHHRFPSSAWRMEEEESSAAAEPRRGAGRTPPSGSLAARAGEAAMRRLGAPARVASHGTAPGSDRARDLTYDDDHGVNSIVAGIVDLVSDSDDEAPPPPAPAAAAAAAAEPAVQGTQGSEATGQCAICFEDFPDCEALSVLKGCGHVFCFLCINQWSAASEKKSSRRRSTAPCPLCKRAFNADRDVVRLYMTVPRAPSTSVGHLRSDAGSSMVVGKLQARIERAVKEKEAVQKELQEMKLELRAERDRVELVQSEKHAAVARATAAERGTSRTVAQLREVESRLLASQREVKRALQRCAGDDYERTGDFSELQTRFSTAAGEVDWERAAKALHEGFKRHKQANLKLNAAVLEKDDEISRIAAKNTQLRTSLSARKKQVDQLADSLRRTTAQLHAAQKQIRLVGLDDVTAGEELPGVRGVPVEPDPPREVRRISGKHKRVPSNGAAAPRNGDRAHKRMRALPASMGGPTGAPKGGVSNQSFAFKRARAPSVGGGVSAGSLLTSWNGSRVKHGTLRAWRVKSWSRLTHVLA